MAKKKFKNPFAGKSAPASDLDIPKNIEDMTMEEMIEEMKEMEKIMGKKKFNKLLEESLQQLAESSGDLGEPNEDDYWYLKKFVTTNEWVRTHPACIKCASDSYYADLANTIADIISDFPLPPDAPEDMEYELGRVLSAYLEDLVSGTRVFSAMRRVCKQNYGYLLPFYDCEHEDYMPDHINEEDIRFLIWKTVCQLGKKNDRTYSPLAPGWQFMAGKIFDELNSRYEEAPEARRVTDWLQRAIRKGDYMNIREIATWLVFRNPLTYFPEYLDDLKEEVEIRAEEEEYVEQARIGQILYGLVAGESWQRSMSPMGCASKTLVAALAAEHGNESLSEDIEKMEVLPQQVYAISREKKTGKIIFETSSHVRLEVERDSFAKGFKVGAQPYAKGNLVRFKGKYLLNGVLCYSDEMKEEWESQHTFLSFEQQKQFAREAVDILEGKQVVCVTNLQKLLKTIDLPASKEKPYPDAKNFIVLVSHEMGIAILPDMGYAFDIPGNRFFRKRLAAQESFADIIFFNSIPQDVAKYIETNRLLPEACIGASQGKETGKRIVQDYMSFWIGFYRQLPAYGVAPRPSISEDSDS